jgi:hypothetical protein
MNTTHRRHWVITLLLSGSLGLPLAALGALGDAPGAPEAESLPLRTSARTVSGTAYSVVEMQTPLGVTIREFQTAEGMVFAVSWKGPFKPDLRQLLGRYFAAFQSAPREQRSRRSRTQSQITLPEVVVHSGGRPRAFAGLAYVPALLPVGVDPAGLQ